MRPLLIARLFGWFALSTLFLWAVSIPASADTILKKDGRELVGKIVTEEETRVEIEIQMGKMLAKIWVLRKEISSIERGNTPTEEFHKRLAALAPHDLVGHQALEAWAKNERLTDAERLVHSLIKRVELAALKHANPRTWCRTCGADGEATCVPCDGKGEHIDACKRCQGEGAIPCKVCKGETGGKVRCRRCAGEGEYEKFDPARGRKVLEKCRDCGAKGELDCPLCHGKGHAECTECEGSKGEVSECEKCHGKPLHTCPTCEGKGIQPTPVTDEEFARERAAADHAAAAKGGDSKKDAEVKPEPVIKKNPFGDR